MPRQPRILVDNLPLHIVQRGHNRERCFVTDNDYLQYLDWLTTAMQKANCQLHAYALVTNHVHLLITPLDAAMLPRMIISVGSRYVRYYNRTYNRSGTLWERRYNSALVATDSYLLACYRYIELNPVRAGIVSDPAEYRWSSYCANALGREERRVVPHSLFTALGHDESSRRNAYRMMFETNLDDETLDEIRRSTNRCQPVGQLVFQSRLRQRVKHEVEP